MPLAIDKGLLTDPAGLATPVVKRVSEVFDEFDAVAHTGLHPEKIAKTRHPRFRIDPAWRCIVLAPEHSATSAAVGGGVSPPAGIVGGQPRRPRPQHKG